MKTIVFVVTMFLLLTSVGAYAGSALDTGEQVIESPSTEPLTIGWELNGGFVDGISVTWTPRANGIYTIRAATGSVTGFLTMPVDSTLRRTDVVPIAGTSPEDLETVSVAITEG